MVMGNYLAIMKQRPNFSPVENVIDSTLVWVQFPKLPLECFYELTLVLMESKVGKTVKVDISTSVVSRGRYAKVCVEVDLNKPLKPTVMVWGKVYAVEYEDLMPILSIGSMDVLSCMHPEMRLNKRKTLSKLRPNQGAPIANHLDHR